MLCYHRASHKAGHVIRKAKREEWASLGAGALHHDWRPNRYLYTTETNHRLSAAFHGDSISVNKQATGSTILARARECVCGVMFTWRASWVSSSAVPYFVLGDQPSL